MNDRNISELIFECVPNVFRSNDGYKLQVIKFVMKISASVKMIYSERLRYYLHSIDVIIILIKIVLTYKLYLIYLTCILPSKEPIKSRFRSIFHQKTQRKQFKVLKSANRSFKKRLKFKDNKT